MTSARTWKRMEREVAAFFREIDKDARRTPLSGNKQIGTLSDITTSLPFFIDAKMRASFLHHSLFKEVEEKATKESKIPILVTHEKNKKQDYLVVIRLKDFIEIIRGNYGSPL